jgi:DNA-binding transcriptional ArsR family regulator
LRVLRDAGLARVRQDAQRRWYELEPGPLTDIDEWLSPYRKFWAGRLDARERHLDAMPAPAGPGTTERLPADVHRHHRRPRQGRP